jgi:hypothetical protein
MCHVSHPALPIASTFAALIKTSAAAGDWSSLLVFVEHMLARVSAQLVQSGIATRYVVRGAACCRDVPMTK